MFGIDLILYLGYKHYTSYYINTLIFSKRQIITKKIPLGSWKRTLAGLGKK
jgi:hypothetical protein